MNLTTRAKLFLVSTAVFIAAAAAAGFELERDLREHIEARMQIDLYHRAELARERIEAFPDPASRETMQPIAVALGKASAGRITIVAPDGTVLADSALSDLSKVENHRARPEIIDAIDAGRGFHRRQSNTRETETMYVAIAVKKTEGVGAVRIATPLAEIDDAVSELRRNIIIAGLFGLAFALALGAITSHIATRQLRALVHRASSGSSGDELAGIAGSFRMMGAELEKTIAALKSERRRFESVLEGLSDAVLAIDRSGAVTVANRAALTLLELEAPPIGRTLLETIRSPELKSLVDRAAREGTVHGELELPGARTRAVHARVRSNDGAVIVLVDLTDIRRLEAVRRDFVANVSHELRTPVSVIRAHAELLEMGGLEDPTRAKTFIDALSRHSERLSRLIDELLDLSKLEAGRYPLDIEPVTAQGAVERAIDAVDVAAKEKKIALLPGSIPTDLSISADRRALEQILVNYLENAVKYSQGGGNVRVDVRLQEDEALLLVIDDGPGIERRHRDRIFERFYRIDTGRSRESGGTGLGLAIVKHLAEAMGGSVGVEPNEPKGSIFWVRLPLALSSGSNLPA
jgi:two-component system phosphate regulon sensor histidine kinase PhoR